MINPVAKELLRQDEFLLNMLYEQENKIKENESSEYYQGFVECLLYIEAFIMKRSDAFKND